MADPHTNHHLPPSQPSQTSSPTRNNFLYSHRHRKRVSFSRLSSDTTTSLPPYRPPPAQKPISTVLEAPSEQPPDYPDSDSAQEADEDTDDGLPPLNFSPPPAPSYTSPRRRRRTPLLQRQQAFYDSAVSQSDIYLDKILERSVAALELSNVLLQSSASTSSAITNVFESSDAGAQDLMLDSSARILTDRITTPQHERWMDDLDNLVRDVDALFGKNQQKDNSVADVDLDVPVTRTSMPLRVARVHSTAGSDDVVSRSLPAASSVASTAARRRPRHSAGSYIRTLDSQSSLQSETSMGRLRLTSPEQQQMHSPPPRPRTQFISASADALISSPDGAFDASAMHIPGFRANATVIGTSASSSSSHVDAPSSSSLSLPPSSPRSPAYVSLVRHAQRSPSATRSSPTASRSSSRTPTYRQRSSSRSSCSNQPPSPHLPRLLPPPIEELPSQSDSSTSESPHPFRTMESLRKILDEQAAQALEEKEKEDEKALGKGKSPERPKFMPRSPPVAPSLKSSTTTTSISRLFTKGTHSTTTRPPDPPKHSSLKRRTQPPTLHTDENGALTANAPLSAASTSNSASDLLSPSVSSGSRLSSGRSTPLRVAFGPLPESYSSSGSRDGTPSRFQEQRAARARRKKKGSGGGNSDASTERDRDGDARHGRGRHSRESASESSWWTTWLTGGSMLSMSANRLEERAEDRMARAPGWGRPGVGGGFEDWAV